MIILKNLTGEQAAYAVENKEFAHEILTSSSKVAIVLSQSWCPWYSRLKSWMSGVEKDAEYASQDLDIYEFIYDETTLKGKFISLKENKWKNGTIPYIRYYVNGSFVRDTNFVDKEDFFTQFNASGSAKIEARGCCLDNPEACKDEDGA